MPLRIKNHQNGQGNNIVKMFSLEKHFSTVLIETIQCFSIFGSGSSRWNFNHSDRNTWWGFLFCSEIVEFSF